MTWSSLSPFDLRLTSRRSKSSTAWSTVRPCRSTHRYLPPGPAPTAPPRTPPFFLDALRDRDLGTSVQALSNSRLSRWTALPTSPPAAARTLATTVVSWPPAMTNSPARPPAPWQPPLAFSRSAASCSRCAEALDTSNSLVARTVSTSDRGTVGKAWIKKSRTPSSPEADGAPWRSPTPASRSETRCSRRRLASATSKVLLTRAASTSSLETVGKACNRKSTPELRRSPAPLPLKWWQMLNSWTSDHQPR
mmetsp:Transcript_1280/g.4420  ORF Transcript_1280/g.4420 Transcript_1280/m.4420 type:complete len:250 (+) Transcript_1280:3913-4662(+)